ncbi:MAG: hypothetical protein KF819_21100 [Labilithrix sp.]|nr:hypothetical protein [Labilithrix sp.]
MRRLLLVALSAALSTLSGCRCDPGPPGGHEPARKSGLPITKPPTASPPKRLAAIEGRISGVVLDDAYAYLSVESDDGRGSIVRVAKKTGETQVLAKGEPGPQAIALAGMPVGSELVWLLSGDLFRDREGAAFARMAKDGSGEIKRTPFKPKGRTGICPIGDAIVLCADAVVRVEKDGATTKLADAPGGMCSVAACDAKHAYIGADGKVHRVALERGDGGATKAELFASPADHLHALTIAGSDVFWADKTGVYKTPIAGGAPSRVSTSSDPVAVLADDNHVYVASLDGAISRIRRSGSAVAQIATTTPSPGRIMVMDKGQLYWSADDGLWSLAR